MIKIHLILEEDVYKQIWEIVKKRYVNPSRKFHIIINEALREYVERHKDDQ